MRVWENCTAPLVPGEGSCPAAAGACVDPSQLRTGMYVRAWNPLDAENLAQAQADCEAEGKTWVAPWVPDI
ncbi:MAG: hypothetical protein K8H88_19565 [Sandaracinaceae bacterium]|nr:hypothetical protein [Sandaracinaceae bacterium]